MVVSIPDVDKVHSLRIFQFRVFLESFERNWFFADSLRKIISSTVPTRISPLPVWQLHGIWLSWGRGLLGLCVCLRHAEQSSISSENVCLHIFFPLYNTHVEPRAHTHTHTSTTNTYTHTISYPTTQCSSRKWGQPMLPPWNTPPPSIILHEAIPFHVVKTMC